MRGGQVDFCPAHGRADVAGDVQVEVVLFNLLHFDAAGITGLFFSELIGFDDLGDVLFLGLVLAFVFYEVLRGVDEQHVVELLALL